MKKKIQRLKLTYCIAAFLAFLGGVTIYAFLRDINNIVFFNFFPKPSFLNTLYKPLQADSIWSNMFIYNLPDGLWLLSGLLFLRVLWYEKPKAFLIYRLCFLFIAFFFEISQMFYGIAGTFDILDLLTMGSITLLESVVHKIKFIRRQL